MDGDRQGTVYGSDVVCELKGKNRGVKGEGREFLTPTFRPSCSCGLVDY